MSTFLALALSLPTAIFTTLLLVLLVYWLLVLVGAVGLDFGGADGAIEAKAGALEGLEAKSGAADAVSGLDAKAGLLESLGFGVVPSTIILTFLTFWAWITSMVGSYFLGPAIGGFAGPWIAGTVVLIAALAASMLLSSVSMRPLKPLFVIESAPKRRQLLGKTAVVASGRVDSKFGQATMEDGGAGFILPIFCSRENTLKKGDQVLLLEYDEKAEAYEVEPVDWLLPEEAQQLGDPKLAEAMARAHLASARSKQPTS